MGDDQDIMTVLQAKVNELKTLSVIARANATSRFGRQFEGDRSLDDALGWDPRPTYQSFDDQYRRGGIAKTIVDIKPEDTWRGDITVTTREKNGKKSARGKKFEAEWLRLWKRLRLKEMFLRVDKLAGIGQYAVMRLGLKEGRDNKPDRAVGRRARELLFVSVFSQVNAEVTKLHNGEQDPRFGRAKIYQVTETSLSTRSIAGGITAVPGVKIGTSSNVHSDRIIHIAEKLMEDELYGTPRLAASYNHLFDLQKLTGGAAEMYWMGAFPGFNFQMDPEVEFDDETVGEMTEQIDNLIMGLKRYVKLQGVKVNELKPQVVSPKDQINAVLDQIAGTTRIPKRKLVGSERGELASSQDENNWDAVIQSRRETDCERWMRDFIDRLMQFGILTAVPEYTINWPSLKSANPKEQSEVAMNIGNALKSYSDADGEAFLPLMHWLTTIIGVPKEVVDQFLEARDDTDEDEDDEGASTAESETRAIIDAAVAKIDGAKSTVSARVEEDVRQAAIAG